MSFTLSHRWKNGSTLLAVVLASAAFGIASPGASAQGARPELAWTSQDAYFMLHARPAQLWKGDTGAKLRQAFGAPANLLGPALEDILGTPPDEIETVTLVGQGVRSTRYFVGGETKKKVDPPREPIKEPKFDPKDKKDFDPKDKDFGFKDKEEFGKGPGFGADFWKEKGMEQMPSAGVKVITTVKPYDRAKVTRALLAGKVLERKVKGKTYLVSSASYPWAVHFVDERTYVVASPPAWMEKLLHGGAKMKGPLAAAVELAGKKHDLVIGFNFTEPSALEMKKDMARDLDNPWRSEPGWVIGPLLTMKTATFALDAGKETKLQASLTFPNADTAERAQASADDALQLLRIFVLGGARQKLRREVEDASEPMAPMFLALLLKQADDGLRGVKVTRTQAELHAVAQQTFDIDAIRARTKTEADAILADEVGRLARIRRVSVNNLKQIGLAIHSFHDVNRMLPPPAICSKKDGTPLLSWRVLILPYIDENPLYNEFKLDEAWDSPHNIKLLPRMPKVFVAPGVKSKESHLTYYQALTGPDAVFPLIPDKNRPFGARNGTMVGITDGTSNTIGIVEASTPVPWTKPDDLVYDAKKALPKMGGTIMPNGFNAVFMDATVRFISNRVDAKTLHALITPRGNEVVTLPDDGQ